MNGGLGDEEFGEDTILIQINTLNPVELSGDEYNEQIINGELYYTKLGTDMEYGKTGIKAYHINGAGVADYVIFYADEEGNSKRFGDTIYDYYAEMLEKQF